MNKFNLKTINWGDRTELIADKPMQSDIWAILSLKMPVRDTQGTQGNFFEGLQISFITFFHELSHFESKNEKKNDFSAKND